MSTEAEQVVADIKAAVAQIEALPRPVKLDFSRWVPEGSMYVAFGSPFDIVVMPWRMREHAELQGAEQLRAHELREWKPRRPSPEELERWQQAEGG